MDTTAAQVFTYVHGWPVLDDQRTLAQLRAEAEPLLDEVVVDRGLLLLDEPTWTLRDDLLWPDTAPGTCLLVVRVPVVPADEMLLWALTRERIQAERHEAEERELRRAEVKRRYRERERELNRERKRRQAAAARDARADVERLGLAG